MASLNPHNLAPLFFEAFKTTVPRAFGFPFVVRHISFPNISLGRHGLGTGSSFEKLPDEAGQWPLFPKRSWPSRSPSSPLSDRRVGNAKLAGRNKVDEMIFGVAFLYEIQTFFFYLKSNKILKRISVYFEVYKNDCQDLRTTWDKHGGSTIHRHDIRIALPKGIGKFSTFLGPRTENGSQ